MEPQHDRRFQETLDALYRGYMDKRALVTGLLDRQFKDPQVILGVARKLDLLPDARRVVKVTGSKGKGSTSRLIAFYLQHLLGDGEKVALFISPEEFVHTDRMRINGAPISKGEFSQAYADLRPHLQEAARTLPEAAYLSPFGIKLLIALAWFRAEGATWHVMETGRGAAHDEVGMMAGAIAVITSILYEHADNLGPGLCDIAREKAAIADATQRTIASSQAIQAFAACSIPARSRFLPESQDLQLRSDLPAWLALDDKLARQVIHEMLPVDDRQLLDASIGGVSAAWGRHQWRGVEIIFDAMINLDSLDRAWFERTFAQHKILLLYSLPDDKDRARLKPFVTAIPNAGSREIVLTGKRVYLKYDDAEAQSGGAYASIHYEDREAFLRELSTQIERHRPSKIYCFGTQTFIRLVRGALTNAAPPR